MKIQLPFKDPQQFPLTQRFGVKFLYRGKICKHKGIDYAMPKFTQICAPFDGVVTRVTPERTTGYGRAIYIKAKNDTGGVVQCICAHLETISLGVGLKVKIGDKIGKSGRTGFWRGVNGYHLHYGISVSGNYIDPFEFMKIEQGQDQNLFNAEDSDVKSFLGSYTVEAGDSLWKIAQRYYGSGGHFMEIFRANEDILKNMNLIHPGQVLRIPALKNNGI